MPAKTAKPVQQEEARYEIRYPQVADYGSLNAKRVNELGDFVAKVKAETPGDEWFDEAIKRAKPKRSVAHDRFSHDAEAALHRVNRDEARGLFSQFVPVKRVEEIGRGFELPPPTVVISTRDYSAEVAAVSSGLPERPIYKRTPVDWFQAMDSPEQRADLMREAIKKLNGYIPWIREFPELDKVTKEIRRATRMYGGLDDE